MYRSADKNVQVGYVAIEIFSLIDFFLKTEDGHKVHAAVTGKRKREARLVVPASYKGQTINKKQAEILDAKLIKKNSCTVTLNCNTM